MPEYLDRMVAVISDGAGGNGGVIAQYPACGRRLLENPTRSSRPGEKWRTA